MQEKIENQLVLPSTKAQPLKFLCLGVRKSERRIGKKGTGRYKWVM
jgi:hypothetical protein